TAPDVPAPAAPGADLPLWPFGLGGLVVLLVGGVLTPALLRARARKQRLTAVAAGGPGAAAAGWAELLAESTDRGVPAKESDTVRAAARRLVREHHLDGAAQQHLRQVVGVVEASWYGGQPAVAARPAATPLGAPPAAAPGRAARRRRRSRRAGRRRG